MTREGPALALITIVALICIILLVRFLYGISERATEECLAQGGEVKSVLVPMMIGQPPRMQMMPRKKCIIPEPTLIKE